MEPSEHNDPVWKLLEHATATDPGPYFTRRVMREVKALEESASRDWFSKLLEHFAPKIAFPALAGVAALAIALTIAIRQDKDLPTVNPGIVLQINETDFEPESEMEAVEYLGQLMAVADPAQLSDAALADLFF
ncbi:MAG: hypothetical protein P1U68_05075 [Verrucomicrobiales bacterium]|nr:hypothetical protein [Verrucomicrobiales bacterium]